MDVAVVGCGIVGASVAFRLAQAGARVWIIDKGEPASGTTSATWGWTNGSSKEELEYFELNYDGLKEHYKLRDELGEAPWFHPDGTIFWAEDEQELRELEERVERVRSRGYAAKWMRASEVNESLEPNVVFPARDAAVAFFSEEAWIDPVQLTNELIKLAVKNGAETRFGTGVRTIETEGGNVSFVGLENGEHIQVDTVVNAAGPDADKVSSLVGLPLPMKPTSGLLVRIAADDVPVRRLVHSSDGINLRPDGLGHLLLHHDSIDSKLWSGVDEDELVPEMLNRARRVVPTLEDAKVVERRVGVRAIPEDGFSCVGGLSALSGYYEAVTHSGVTLGPLIGRLLTQEILSETVTPVIAPFRPDRFARDILGQGMNDTQVGCQESRVVTSSGKKFGE